MDIRDGTGSCLPGTPGIVRTDMRSDGESQFVLSFPTVWLSSCLPAAFPKPRGEVGGKKGLLVQYPLDTAACGSETVTKGERVENSDLLIRQTGPQEATW